MIWLWTVAAFIIGTVAGFALAYGVLRHSAARGDAELAALKEEMRQCFGSLSLDTLGKLTEEFNKLASERLAGERNLNAKELESKKELIDKQLDKMNLELKGVTTLVQELEKDREKKFGELSSRLTAATETTSALLETTNNLNRALSSTSARGQWGERMAEDVLRISGFIENINYVKQKALSGGTRPDYTFLLPRELKLNMDVKFPLDNYVAYLDSENETESQQYLKKFLGDVKNRIKEVTGREYISVEDNTVDCVLLFIPNEQIYSFIQENDSSIVDYGLENRVLLCSPVTLIAILAVIRQAIDNFTLARTSNEILSIFGRFQQQWNKFTDKLDSLGSKIETVQRGYGELAGTRRRMLEKPLNEIEDLRMKCHIPISPDDGEELEEVEGETISVLEAEMEDE